MAQSTENTLGNLLGRGASAEVYEWGHHQALKLYKPGVPKKMVEWEANNTRLVHAAGIKVPQVGELLELDGRFGLVLERIYGKTMEDLIVQKPWRTRYYWRMLVELRIKLFNAKIDAMGAQREGIKKKIKNLTELGPSTKAQLLASIEQLPDGNAVIHRDFHPGNIMITSEGPVIIDWIGASKGNPLSDVARTWLILSHYQSTDLRASYLSVAPYLRPFHRQILKNISKHYWNHYFKLRPGDKKELEVWKPIMAAVSLDDGMGTEKVRLKLIHDAFPEIHYEKPSGGKP